MTKIQNCCKYTCAQLSTFALLGIYGYVQLFPSIFTSLWQFSAIIQSWASRQLVRDKNGGFEVQIKLGNRPKEKITSHTMNISRMMLNEYLLIVLLLAQILTHGASARYETRNIVDEDDYFSRNISNHVYINYGKSASCLGYVNTSLSSDSFQIKPPVVCGGGFGGSSSRMVTFKRKYAMHRALPNTPFHKV
jgi:hypothetical protein